MPSKLIFSKVYDKVNETSCQTADSTVSICTSIEPELNDLKKLINSQVLKNEQKM